MSGPVPPTAFEDSIKGLIGDPKDRIALDDQISRELRKVIDAQTSSGFWDSLPEANGSGIQQRLAQYERTIGDLTAAAVLLGRWGQPEHVMTLEKMLLRLAEANRPPQGLALWQAMRWYSLCFLMYAAGIAAFAGRNYAMLTPIFLARSTARGGAGGRPQIIEHVLDEVGQLDDAFRRLPPHQKHRVPRSEYLFNTLQPLIDRLIYLGEGYESTFDDFEIVSALVYADLTTERRGRVWGPPGRFGYKSALSGGPFEFFVGDAQKRGKDMPLLKIGLFSSSPSRFEEIAREYAQFLSHLGWF